ncbi:MAG: sigma-70 family RNA polymerase sigma factor [Bacteroidales bacterium]|nr:sigma-70 family RNA polymerase sigma factor [Bacteroidales bacterium]
MDTQGKAIYERIEHIYKTSKDVLLRTAYMFVRDEEAARDIVAEAFMTLIENRQEVNPEKFYPYLYSIVQHKAIDHRRADIRHSRIAQKIRTKEERMMEYYTLAIESASVSEVHSSEIMEIYRNRLNSFPELTRRIFLLSRRDGKTRSEIASELGISENKVKYEIQKVLETLKGALKDYGEYSILIIMILGSLNIF